MPITFTVNNGGGGGTRVSNTFGGTSMGDGFSSPFRSNPIQRFGSGLTTPTFPMPQQDDVMDILGRGRQAISDFRSPDPFVQDPVFEDRMAASRGIPAISPAAGEFIDPAGPGDPFRFGVPVPIPLGSAARGVQAARQMAPAAIQRVQQPIRAGMQHARQFEMAPRVGAGLVPPQIQRVQQPVTRIAEEAVARTPGLTPAQVRQWRDLFGERLRRSPPDTPFVATGGPGGRTLTPVDFRTADPRQGMMIEQRLRDATTARAPFPGTSPLERMRQVQATQVTDPAVSLPRMQPGLLPIPDQVTPGVIRDPITGQFQSLEQSITQQSMLSPMPGMLDMQMAAQQPTFSPMQFQAPTVGLTPAEMSGIMPAQMQPVGLGLGLGAGTVPAQDRALAMSLMQQPQLTGMMDMPGLMTGTGFQPTGFTPTTGIPPHIPGTPTTPGIPPTTPPPITPGLIPRFEFGPEGLLELDEERRRRRMTELLLADPVAPGMFGQQPRDPVTGRFISIEVDGFEGSNHQQRED